jgi:hypothetical protein
LASMISLPPNPRLLLSGRERLRRRGVALTLVCAAAARPAAEAQVVKPRHEFTADAIGGHLRILMLCG